MNSNVALEVKGVSKKFTADLKRSMVYGAQDFLLSFLRKKKSQEISLRKGEFWALKDITFEVKRGEALGILGPNGSGKTTLLRTIAGILHPEQGQIRVSGRVGTLLTAGTGFHPHMTGRENVYLYGLILGMTRPEIDEVYNEILSFADLGEFIEAPLGAYSAGMAVRLGFAVLAHSNSEILVIDEALAASDQSFQKKWLEKVVELKLSGKSVVLVSHSATNLEKVCDVGIYLKEGRQVCLAPIHECVALF